MVSAQNLSFSYGANRLLDEVNFSVENNSKVGLVGPNGAGKSTLFSLITKKELPNSGKILVDGTVGFVPQEVKVDPMLENSRSIRDYLDEKGELLDYELEKMLSGLELNLSLSQSPKKLSGGQKTKLALARALLSEPDVLLLDEPTNFLDIAGKKWVMNFLANYPKTVIVISHDLELMDKHISKVIVINPFNKKIEEYKGTYSSYIKQKALADALLKRKIINEQKHIKRMEEGLKKLYRHQSEKGVRQRVMLQRRIERAKENLPEMPKELRRIKISLPEISWVGEIPIKAINIEKSYGDKKVLENINFYIERGERVALIGPNGVGKSTLIKILMQMLEPDSGEVIRDQNLKVGYYSQEFETLDLEETVLETVRKDVHLPVSNIRPILAKFLFPGDKIFQQVKSLSGGEKTRLSIALLMLHDYNLLILDEPTTYLDVLSQRVILEALKEYKGAMLIVSHTEDFIKELQPNRYILLPEGEVDFWRDELLDRVSEI